MNKFSKPYDFAVRDTYVPLPVDQIGRAALQLQAKRDASLGARDETLAALAQAQADTRGIYADEINRRYAAAEAQMNERLAGDGWINGATDIRRLARDTQRDLQPVLSSVGQVNAAVQHAQTLNLTPREREWRLGLIDREAREAAANGTPYTGRQFVERPDIVGAVTRFAGQMAAADVENLGLTQAEFGMLRSGRVESLSEQKLLSIMNAVIATEPSIQRYLEETIEASPDFNTAEEVLNGMGFRTALSTIARGMSYDRTTESYSGSGRSGSDNDVVLYPSSIAIEDDTGVLSDDSAPSYGNSVQGVAGRWTALTGGGAPDASGNFSEGAIGHTRAQIQARGWDIIRQNGEMVIVNRGTTTPVTGREVRELTMRLNSQMNEADRIQARIDQAEERFLGGRDLFEWLREHDSEGEAGGWADAGRRALNGLATAAMTHPLGAATAGAAALLQPDGVLGRGVRGALRSATGRGPTRESRNLISQINTFLREENQPKSVYTNMYHIVDPTSRGMMESYISTARGPGMDVRDMKTGRPLPAAQRDQILAAGVQNPAFFLRPNGSMELTFSPSYASGQTGPLAGSFSLTVPQSMVPQLMSTQGASALMVHSLSERLTTGLDTRGRSTAEVTLAGPDGRPQKYRLRIERDRATGNYTYSETLPDGTTRRRVAQGPGSPSEAANDLAELFLRSFQP